VARAVETFKRKAEKLPYGKRARRAYAQSAPATNRIRFQRVGVVAEPIPAEVNSADLGDAVFHAAA
jgi:hypothetical protein